GDVLIAGVGASSGTTIADLGEPIPGTNLRLGKGEPDYFIVVPRSLGLVALLSLLCLLGGAFALWLRKVGTQGAIERLQRAPKTIEPEITLSQALKQQSQPPVVPAATPAPTRPAAKPAIDEVV